MSFSNDDLPGYKDLDIKNLSNCFKNVLNSYKFYWFLAILDHVAERNDPFISMEELSLRMLSSVWYPLDYFKLSFGKQDSFRNLAISVSSYMRVDNSLNAPTLMWQIENKLPEEIAYNIKRSIKETLKRWVTYRFLSPFFNNQLRGTRDQQVNNIIEKLTNEERLKHYTPYRIVPNGIILSEKWIEYFKVHQYILKGFISWHLVRFLQKNNPGVVGLSEKLEKPKFRDLKDAKVFWSKYLFSSEVSCVYCSRLIPKTGFSLDHFIPWSYVAHDQLWNIIPTIKSVNSSKSDALPNLKSYLSTFCDLQFDAFKMHVDLGNNRLLEDYQVLFKQTELQLINSEDFKNVIGLEITNNYRIAENLGFKANYIYEL
ncbi:HNH endonuclease [Mucilaginibacter sp. OK268]|uniref:HNH endonuclease domain-containing protein n=1 Tax=Mucilaginibacter sp. OK268 TaxID=1881048 RepID=UPI00088F4828|nr:HNH endonuclease domain-containing protein [Mucilaginibacter sp. OK268]SDP45765.1 HNH endonuclease [Mucilaginibacter sp. OK268]